MNNHIDVSLRNATEKDLDMVFIWQNIKLLRQFFLNPIPPTLEEHRKWFLNIINFANVPYYIIMYKEQECGAIRLDCDMKTKKYTLSWYIIPEFQGLGVGTTALILALKTIQKPAIITASVHSGNIASIKSLTKAGFEKIHNNTFRYEKIL